MNLMNGDALTKLKEIPDNSIDMILTDPPYGTTRCSWDVIVPMDKLWEQFKRVIKKNHAIVICADQPFTSVVVASNFEWFKYEWIWQKDKVLGFLTANYRPMRNTEDILVFSEGGAAAASRSTNSLMPYYPQGLVSVDIDKTNSEKRLGKMLDQKNNLGENNKMRKNGSYKQKFTNYPSEILKFPLDRNTVHPTQKPVALMEYLIKTYTKEGERVLDCFMGSGTTGVACVNTKRDFVGIELSTEYFNIAKERINHPKPKQQELL